MIKPNATLGIAIAVLLAFTPLAAIATTQQQTTHEQALETQNTIRESVEVVDDIEIDTRYSPIGKVEPDDGVAALAVECPPGEVPENPQYQLAENVGVLQSMRVGLDDDTMAWLLLVQNYGDEKQWIWLAADCNEARDGDDDDDDADDDDTTIVNRIDITNIFKFINKNIVINKNVTVIGNGTSGNGSVTVPPPTGNTTIPPVNNTTTAEETTTDTTTNNTIATTTTEEEEEETAAADNSSVSGLPGQSGQGGNTGVAASTTTTTEEEEEEEEEEETNAVTPQNSETTNGELTDDNDNTVEGN